VCSPDLVVDARGVGLEHPVLGLQLGEQRLQLGLLRLDLRRLLLHRLLRLGQFRALLLDRLSRLHDLRLHPLHLCQHGAVALVGLPARWALRGAPGLVAVR